jgi:DNA-binding MarR family transcriptional regulator
MATSRRKLAADAWGSLLRLHAALVPALDQHLQSAVGLPLGWYDALLELSVAPGQRLRMSELADRVVLSRSRVSRIVDELDAAGLVRREQNPDDGRSAYTVLTTEGMSRFRQAAPIYLAGIQAQFAASFTDEELRTLTELLDRACGWSQRGGSTGIQTRIVEGPRLAQS